MPLRRAAHSVYDCHYHLVWTPKRRRAVLSGEIRERLGELFVQIAEAYDIGIEEMHVAEDHVHLFVWFPPRLSISQVVMYLKSLSARKLFSEYPELRRRMWNGALWEDGFFVRTVGEGVEAEVVRRYIRRHEDEEISEEQ